jgi:hypothetical protein
MGITMTRKTFSLLIVMTAPAFAQPFGAGFKVGLPLNDAFELRSSNNLPVSLKNKSYIIGPQFELRLPAGFSIELDALYTSFKVNSIGSVASSVSGVAFSTDSWEFPLMLKKKFGGPNAGVASVRPFVDVGASFRRLEDIGGIGGFITGSSDDNQQMSSGFVIGGGLEIRALFIRFSPEIRFTRWGTDNFREGLANVFKSNKNQAQFLVGISF